MQIQRKKVIRHITNVCSDDPDEESIKTKYHNTF